MAFAEVLLAPGGRDVRLGTAGTLEAVKITSFPMNNEQV